MPCLKILTNVPRNKIPTDFAEKIIPVLSKTVGKPQERFLCLISGDCLVSCFGNNTSPVAVATLESVGQIDPVRNITISKELSEYIFKTIGVRPEHFFISFYDMKASNVGVGGTTVEARTS